MTQLPNWSIGPRSLTWQSARETYEKRLRRTEVAESADYEVSDGPMHRKHAKLIRLNDKYRHLRHLVSRTIMCILVGAFAACLYLALHHGTSYITAERIRFLRKYLASGITTTTGNVAIAWAFSFGLALAMCFVGVAVTLYEPCAAGSGMPEVIAFLNGLYQRRYSTIKTYICKALGVLLIVNAGLFSGFDGPYIHLCTIFAAVMVRNWRKVPVLGEWAYGEKPDKSQPEVSNYLAISRTQMLRQFVTIGAASGMASAFQAPVGGAMFALEEAMSFYEPSLIIRCLFAASISLLVLSASKQGGKVASVDLSLYATNATCNLLTPVQDYVAIAVMGVVAGVSGHVYNVVVAKIRVLRTIYVQPYIYRRFLEAYWTADSADPGPTARHPLKDACFQYINNRVCLDDKVRGIVVSATEQLYANISNNCPAGTASSRLSLLPNSASQTQGVVQDLFEQYGYHKALPEGILLDSMARVKSKKATTRITQQSTKRTNNNNNNNNNRNQKREVEEVPNISDEAERDLEENIAAPCYHQMKSLLFNQPELVLKNLFVRGYYNMFQSATLAVFGAIYVVMSLATHHISMPTDMVIPTLIIGATFGRLYGVVVNEFKIMLHQTLVDPGAYAVLGMAAFWSGTSRMVVTVIVVAIETTYEQSYLPGLVIVVLTAVGVGNMLGESQFHMEIEQSGMHFLPFSPSANMDELTVDEIMTRDPIVVNVGESLGAVAQKIGIADLLASKDVSRVARRYAAAKLHNGFPVVISARDRQLAGLILRSQVEDAVENAKLGEQSMGWLAYVNMSPHTVQATCSAGKAYRMFRALGLRHLVVVNEDNRVVGLLTRPDFTHVMHEHEGIERHSFDRDGNVNDDDDGDDDDNATATGSPPPPPRLESMAPASPPERMQSYRPFQDVATVDESREWPPMPPPVEQDRLSAATYMRGYRDSTYEPNDYERDEYGRLRRSWYQH
ncbi:hypothetical protein RI367_004912 [Sorochytrium milnesiophthora]